MLAGGHPVLLGIGVDLEDMRPCAVDRLLPEGDKEEMVNLFVPQNRGLTKATGCTCTTRESEDHLSGLHLAFSRNQRNSGGPTHLARYIGVLLYGALDEQIQVAQLRWKCQLFDRGRVRESGGVGTKYSMEEGNLSWSHDLHIYPCASVCSKTRVASVHLSNILSKVIFLGTHKMK